MSWADLDPEVLRHGMFVSWVVGGYVVARLVLWAEGKL